MFVETRKVWNIAAALMLLWRSVDKYNIPKKYRHHKHCNGMQHSINDRIGAFLHLDVKHDW